MSQITMILKNWGSALMCSGSTEDMKEGRKIFKKCVTSMSMYHPQDDHFWCLKVYLELAEASLKLKDRAIDTASTQVVAKCLGSAKEYAQRGLHVCSKLETNEFMRKKRLEEIKTECEAWEDGFKSQA